MRRPASSKNDAHPVHRPPGLRSRDSTPRLPSYRDDCLYRRANSGSAIFIAARPQRLSNCRAIACKLPALPKTVSSLRHSNYRAVGLNRRPGGRRTGRAPFFDEAGRLIEKSQLRFRRQFRIGLGMFSLVTFFAPKKVTRAPARKRSQALPTLHKAPTSAETYTAYGPHISQERDVGTKTN